MFFLKKMLHFFYWSKLLNKKLWSILPEVFHKKSVLKNFPKFTGKHLCPSLFLNKVSGLRPVILLKKRLWHRCFPANFGKFLQHLFIEHLRWLLLKTLFWLIFKKDLIVKCRNFFSFYFGQVYTSKIDYVTFRWVISESCRSF